MDLEAQKTLRAVVGLVTALVILGVGVACAFEVGSALRREHEYRAAPACVSVPVEISACLWKQDFSVRSVVIHRGRRRPPEAELLTPSGTPWTVTFRDTDPVVSELQPGDKVVGVVWHGQVVEVRNAGGQRQQTEYGPLEWPEDRLGGALGCISLGLIVIVGSVWALVTRGRPRHATAAAVVRWHGVAIGCTAIAALWIQSANGLPMWAIPAIWGPAAFALVASMVAFVMAALRGGLDSTDFQPALPRDPGAPEPKAPGASA